MRNTSSRGFVDLTLLVAVIIVVLIGGFVWWRVQQYEEPKIVEQITPPTSEQETIDEIIDYQVPEGWIKRDCANLDSDQVLLSPENDPAQSCDDRTEAILMSYITANDVDPQPTVCDPTDSQIAADKFLSNYTCDEVSLENESALRISFSRPDDMNLVEYRISNETDQISVTFYSEDADSPLKPALQDLANSVTFR